MVQHFKACRAILLTSGGKLASILARSASSACTEACRRAMSPLCLSLSLCKFLQKYVQSPRERCVVETRHCTLHTGGIHKTDCSSSKVLPFEHEALCGRSLNTEPERTHSLNLHNLVIGSLLLRVNLIVQCLEPLLYFAGICLILFAGLCQVLVPHTQLPARSKNMRHGMPTLHVTAAFG